MSGIHINFLWGKQSLGLGKIFSMVVLETVEGAEKRTSSRECPTDTNDYYKSLTFGPVTVVTEMWVSAGLRSNVHKLVSVSL